MPETILGTLLINPNLKPVALDAIDLEIPIRPDNPGLECVAAGTGARGSANKGLAVDEREVEEVGVCGSWAAGGEVAGAGPGEGGAYEGGGEEKEGRGLHGW